MLTYLNLSNATIGDIKSDAVCNITLAGSSVNSIKTSTYNDRITLVDTNVTKNVEAGLGSDTIDMTRGSAKNVKADDTNNTVIINGAKIEENLETQGETTIYGAEIKHALTKGNVAIQASDITTLGGEKTQDNIYVKNSNIGTRYYDNYDKVYETQFGIPANMIPRERQNKAALETSAYEKLLQLTGEEQEAIDVFLEEQKVTYSADVIALYEALGLKLNSDNTINEAEFKNVLLREMETAISSLEQAFKDDKNSRGLGGEFTGLFTDGKTQDKIDRLKASYTLAKNSNDLMTIVDTYKVITKDTDVITAVQYNGAALSYANSLSKDEKVQVLDMLDVMINSLEYSLTEENGCVKQLISVFNQFIDIGTNENEARTKIATLRRDINALREGVKSGNITSEDFCTKYKAITGYAFVEENVNTLFDNKRGNSAFSNDVQNKIQSYKDTQQTIFQVGEFVIVVAAGAVVSVASCGACGPAVASALHAMGRVGVSLAATTVSFVARETLEFAEKQTNNITSDDITKEQVMQSAALMYAGCISGQIGGYINELVSNSIASGLDSELLGIVMGKIADLASDTAICYMTTAMIRGDASISEEFWQNVQGWIIGSLQSRLTGYYYRLHADEIELKTQIYNKRQEFKNQGLSTEEQNAKLLASVGLSEELAAKYSTSEIDTMVMAQIIKANIDYTPAKNTDTETLDDNAWQGIKSYLDAGKIDEAIEYMKTINLDDTTIRNVCMQYAIDDIYAGYVQGEDYYTTVGKIYSSEYLTDNQKTKLCSMVVLDELESYGIDVSEYKNYNFEGADGNDVLNDLKVVCNCEKEKLNFTPEQTNRYNTLKSMGIEEKFAVNWATWQNESVIECVQKLVKEGMEISDIQNLFRNASVTEDYWNITKDRILNNDYKTILKDKQELKALGFSEDKAETYSFILDNDSLASVKSLAQKFGGEEIGKLLENYDILDNFSEWYPTILKLSECGLKPAEIETLLTTENYDIVSKNLGTYTKEQMQQKAQELKSLGYSDSEVQKWTYAKDEQFVSCVKELTQKFGQKEISQLLSHSDIESDLLNRFDAIKELSPEKIVVVNSIADNKMDLAAPPSTSRLFDTYNIILNGKLKDNDLKVNIDEISEKFGTNIRYDNDATSAAYQGKDVNPSKYISDETLKAITFALQKLKDANLPIPEEIYLTSYFKDENGVKAAGVFWYSNPDAISLNLNNPDFYIASTLIHETHHYIDHKNAGNTAFLSQEKASALKITTVKNTNKIDIALGLTTKMSTIKFDGKTIKAQDISGLISDYATTNLQEFVAEVGTLVTSGAIYKDASGNWAISKNNSDGYIRGKYCTNTENIDKLGDIMELYYYLTTP